MPLVAINALPVINRSGTGYYTQKLLEFLPRASPEFEYKVILPSSFWAHPLCSVLSRSRNVDLVFWRGLGRSSRVIYEQAALGRLVAKWRADLLHSPAFVSPVLCRARSIVTIHDLAYLIMPETLPWSRWLYMSMLVRRSVVSSDAVIAVSHKTKEEVVRHLGLEPGQVYVCYEGAPPALCGPSETEKRHIRRLLRWDGRFIFFWGTIEPRKNLGRLVEAFGLLRHRWGEECKLVIAGRWGWLSRSLVEDIARRGLRDEVIFTGFLPRRVAMGLMRLAAVFVLPSLDEGFGLPLLDAMACGTPIAASCRGAIPEVVGDAALLFDPYDVEEMAEAIHSVLVSPQVRERLISAGSARLGLFSWERCAQQTVEVYRRVLSC